MILRQIERIRRSARIDVLATATSLDPSDDPLTRTLEDAGEPVFRGSLGDVLDRFVGALNALGPAEHVIRLTADCPLTDWTVIDTVIERHLDGGADYTSNTWGRRTFPKGLDVEAARSRVLREAAAEATDPYEREHVTPFIYRRPERYDLRGVSQASDEGEVRWTVDVPSDLQFAAAVYEGLYQVEPAFTSQDVRAFVGARPELAKLGGERRI